MTTQPLWLWVAGVVVLGIILAYGFLRNRTRTRQEPAISEEATKENYKQEDRRPNSALSADRLTENRRCRNDASHRFPQNAFARVMHGQGTRTSYIFLATQRVACRRAAGPKKRSLFHQ